MFHYIDERLSHGARVHADGVAIVELAGPRLKEHLLRRHSGWVVEGARGGEDEKVGLEPACGMER